MVHGSCHDLWGRENVDLGQRPNQHHRLPLRLDQFHHPADMAQDRARTQAAQHVAEAEKRLKAWAFFDRTAKYEVRCPWLVFFSSSKGLPSFQLSREPSMVDSLSPSPRTPANPTNSQEINTRSRRNVSRLAVIKSPILSLPHPLLRFMSLPDRETRCRLLRPLG